MDVLIVLDSFFQTDLHQVTLLQENLNETHVIYNILFLDHQLMNNGSFAAESQLKSLII